MTSLNGEFRPVKLSLVSYRERLDGNWKKQEFCTFWKKFRKLICCVQLHINIHWRYSSKHRRKLSLKLQFHSHFSETNITMYETIYMQMQYTVFNWKFWFRRKYSSLGLIQNWCEIFVRRKLCVGKCDTDKS